jgi:c(7)-type cytochrome triheme protein
MMLRRSSRLRPSSHKVTCVLGAVLLIASGVLVQSVTPPHSPEAELRLPPDQVLDQQDSPAPVIFSHANHTAYTDNRCQPCHPTPFSILGRHRPMLHEEMDAGSSCGVCHNGHDATDVTDPESCDVCHMPRG